MKVLFVLGMGLMLAAPLLRRRFGLAHLDPRFGQAANESDRRFYHLFLACEIPVLVLALIFLRHLRWAFWLGWGINLALALYLTVIVIWLEFLLALVIRALADCRISLTIY